MLKRLLLLAAALCAATAAPAAASSGYGALPPFAHGDFFQPADLAVDGQAVYVADPINDRVHRFTRDGAHVWSAVLDGAASIAVHDGALFVLAGSAQQRVHRLDPAGGASLGSFGESGTGDDRIQGAHRLDVAANGDVYVLDQHAYRIKRFGSDGTPKGAFGANGTGPGQFTHGSGLAVDDARGFVYVVDYHQRRVQKFGLDGAFLLQWTTPAGSMPYDPAVDSDGNVLVPDFELGTIRKYTPSGQAWPVPMGSEGPEVGQLSLPYAVAVEDDDPSTPVDGRVYVADAGNDRVSAFGWYDTDQPDVEIGLPADGATYPQGGELYPDWYCGDAFEPVSCVAEHDGAEVQHGEPIRFDTPGQHTFTVRAEDPFGNERTVTHTFTVEAAQELWPWQGFFSPIDRDAVNTAKAGSAIPVKFSLGGDRGLDVFADGYPRSVRIPCDSSADHDAIEETATPGGSALSYDAESDRYVYVWQTAKSWSSEPGGPCRQLVVKLRDGSEHRARFRFR